MLLIQYLVLLLLGFMIFFLIKRRTELSIPKFLIWITITLIIAIISIRPIQISNFISKIVGIERGIDALFAIGLIAAHTLMLKLYIKVYELENQITEMNRKISIRMKELEDDLKKNSGERE